jgi:transcriptional regulator with XRE-family HTH domain
MTEKNISLQQKPDTLGQRIKYRRECLGLTQHQLARALELTPQHISAIEQDKRSPSLSSLARLAEELGVTTDYLITGKEGTVAGIVTAIKANKYLNISTKNALITIINDLNDFKSE